MCAFVRPGRTGSLLAIPAITLGAVLFAAPASSADAPTARSRTTTSQDCLDTVNRAIAAGKTGVSSDMCSTTSTLTVSEERTVTVDDVASAKDALSTQEYRSLMRAAESGEVRSKDYAQSVNNVVNGVTQYGTFYYDGGRAWVAESYRGYQGSHTCQTQWAVGYVVELKKCVDYGSPDERVVQGVWHFSVIPSGGLVNWDETHELHVNATGSIWQ